MTAAPASVGCSWASFPRRFGRGSARPVAFGLAAVRSAVAGRADELKVVESVAAAARERDDVMNLQVRVRRDQAERFLEDVLRDEPELGERLRLERIDPDD
jgi:hypothetical protein